MKKLSLIAAAFSMLTLVSCEKDEDGNPDNSSRNVLNYNEQELEINFANTIDFGSTISTGNRVNEFHTQSFLLGDGNYSAETETTTGGYRFATKLISEGSDFTPGTFTIISHEAMATNLPYGNASLVLDANEDNILNGADTEIEAVGGTVTIEGTADNYTITVDVDLSNNEKLTGEYTGTVTVVE